MGRRSTVDVVERAEHAGVLADEELIGLLAEIADELDVVNPRQTALWRARTILLHEARRREGAPVLAVLAHASRVSEVAIVTALKKPDPLAS